MPKKKIAKPSRTEGPFGAVKRGRVPSAWHVTAHDQPVAAVVSATPQADAERIAACLNALEDIPTEAIAGGLVVRLWLAVRNLADLLEGVPINVPADKLPAFKADALRIARESLAAVGRGQTPTDTE